MSSSISLVKQLAKSDISDLFEKKKTVHFFFVGTQTRVIMMLLKSVWKLVNKAAITWLRALFRDMDCHVIPYTKSLWYMW